MWIRPARNPCPWVFQQEFARHTWAQKNAEARGAHARICGSSDPVNHFPILLGAVVSSAAEYTHSFSHFVSGRIQSYEQ
jgi:hypothetical protein